MCGEAMSEGMRADGFVDAILLGEFFHDEEDHLACESCATAVEENGVGEFGFRRDVQPCTFDVLEEDFQAAVADGHEPFLAAFADDAQEAVVAVDIADLQSDEFRDAQAAAVHHLDHRFVAMAGGLAEVDAVDHLLDFLIGKHFGEMTAQGGRGDEHGWVGLGDFLLDEIAPKRLQPGEDAGLRGRPDVHVVEVGEEILDVALFDVIDCCRDGVHTVSTIKVLQKQVDVMAIGLHAVIGQRKLQPQVVGKVLDEVGGEVDLVHRFVLRIRISRFK